MALRSVIVTSSRHRSSRSVSSGKRPSVKPAKSCRRRQCHLPRRPPPVLSSGASTGPAGRWSRSTPPDLPGGLFVAGPQLTEPQRDGPHLLERHLGLPVPRHDRLAHECRAAVRGLKFSRNPNDGEPLRGGFPRHLMVCVEPRHWHTKKHTGIWHVEPAVVDCPNGGLGMLTRPRVRRGGQGRVSEMARCAGGIGLSRRPEVPGRVGGGPPSCPDRRVHFTPLRGGRRA